MLLNDHAPDTVVHAFTDVPHHLLIKNKYCLAHFILLKQLVVFRRFLDRYPVFDELVKELTILANDVKSCLEEGSDRASAELQAQAVGRNDTSVVTGVCRVALTFCYIVGRR